MFELRKHDRCPIHPHQVDCCCRPQRAERFEQKQKHRPMKRSLSNKWVKIGNGIYRMDDPHVPQGFRIRRSKAAMRDLLVKKLREQNGCCFYCHKQFDSFGEVTPDHRNPRGMGGAFRDDSEENIVAACAGCNDEKGSKRI